MTFKPGDLVQYVRSDGIYDDVLTFQPIFLIIKFIRDDNYEAKIITAGHFKERIGSIGIHLFHDHLGWAVESRNDISKLERIIYGL